VKVLLHFALLLGSCCLLFAASGCKPAENSLIGTYAVEQNGKQGEFVRIEQEGDKFFFSEKDGREWLGPEELYPATKSEVESLLNQPVDGKFTGLSTDLVAILQVPKGWKVGKFESKTGYVLASQLGLIELHKSAPAK
jgi:hypothetical protein